MRYCCYFCWKSVTTELPADSVIRAVLVCPECVEKHLKDEPPEPLESKARTTLNWEGA